MNHDHNNILNTTTATIPSTSTVCLTVSMPDTTPFTTLTLQDKVDLTAIIRQVVRDELTALTRQIQAHTYAFVEARY